MWHVCFWLQQQPKAPLWYATTVKGVRATPYALNQITRSTIEKTELDQQ
jgi:hypothetical protein